jgi:transcriptional regulator with GAF, ATPase, and Fis domain
LDSSLAVSAKEIRNEPFLKRVMASGEGVLCTELSSDLAIDELHTQSRAAVCVPIRGRSGSIGAIYVDKGLEPGGFDSGDLGVLQAFADSVASEVQRARVHGEMARRIQELDEERARAQSLIFKQQAEIERLRGKKAGVQPVQTQTVSEAQRSERQSSEFPRGHESRMGRDSFERAELSRILNILEKHRWNVTKALVEIGIPRATLYRILKRNEIVLARVQRSGSK